MKTLVIVSHPSLNDSTSQQFLINSINHIQDVTVHHLETEYPNGGIEREREQTLLRSHQRIILQFPLYWYSSPALLKEWQDVVFTGEQFYQGEGTILSGKQLGLVLTIGVKKADYQAGGREGTTVDELMRPFQAVARHMGMNYLPHFGIHQFAYLSEMQKKSLLIAYQYYLTGVQPSSLDSRTTWLLDQLRMTERATLPAGTSNLLETVISEIEERQSFLSDLKRTMEDF